jgi:hypothetical protein
MAIEAMKRKIEARMKGQGVAAQEGIAQRIAVSIVDQTATTGESPAISPTALNPEATRDIVPILETTISESSSKVDTPVSGSETKAVDTTTDSPAPIIQSPLKIDTDLHPESQQQDSRQQEGSPMDTDDDEESRLLAELESERLAEEAARKKRKDLEDRLRNARGKKQFRSTSAMSERDGAKEEVVHAVQDSTSSLLE